MNSGQRLDRLEDELETVKQLLISAASVTESNSKAISRLAERVDRLTGSVDQVTERVDRLAERFDRFVEQAESDRAVLREMQAEVRGIQTENQRILEFLFGQQRGE